MKQKINKIINEKNGESKILISIITLALFFGIIIVSALTTEDALQNELSLLENELSSNDYSWFINYSVLQLVLNTKKSITLYSKKDN